MWHPLILLYCPLAGICRAHGLTHQRVNQPQELSKALAAARGLNKHSVVEVITSRETNVGQHRDIQEAVKEAVLHALKEHTETHTGGTADKVGMKPSPCDCSLNLRGRPWIPFAMPVCTATYVQID